MKIKDGVVGFGDVWEAWTVADYPYFEKVGAVTVGDDSVTAAIGVAEVLAKSKRLGDIEKGDYNDTIHDISVSIKAYLDKKLK